MPSSLSIRGVVAEHGLAEPSVQPSFPACSAVAEIVGDVGVYLYAYRLAFGAGLLSTDSGGLPRQELRLDQQVRGFHSQGAGDRFQSLEPGRLFPVLQPYQGNPPDGRSPGQRLLGQPGRLPISPDPFADGLPLRAAMASTVGR